MNKENIKLKKKKRIEILLQENDSIFKKAFHLKWFEYKNHEFYLTGNIKIGYEIGDVLTGCLIDIGINHIKELTKIKPKLDTFLSIISLKQKEYLARIEYLNRKEQ